MRLLTCLLWIPGMKQMFRRIFFRQQAIHLAGLELQNPVGMAAGFDKNGAYVDALACLGFGYVEVGTVTPRPQPGNDKPRLFRLRADRALINRMGFNNDGATAIAARLQRRKSSIVVGGNIGKNKATPNEEAVADFESCFRTLHPVVDYFVVNVSSPNTPGLRALQEKEPLMKILGRLVEVGKSLSVGGRRPIFVKIAPDLSDSQLDEILEVVTTCGLDGIVATNTTLSRAGLKSSVALAAEAGGCSGRPLNSRAVEVVRYISQKTHGKLPIMGVGGIFSAEDATVMRGAGANAVQLYTGFIYEGPGLVKRIVQAWK